MYIVNIEYTAPLNQIDEVLAEHRAWLDKHYQIGTFLFSGPQNPRLGGIIVATSTSKEELEQLLQQDPFVMHKVAKHRIIEFQAIKSHPSLSRFKDN